VAVVSMIPQIRSTHRYAYRSGEWAILVGVKVMEITNFMETVTRPCYLVMFPDGVTDSWPIFDPDVKYEYQNLTVNS